MSGRFTDLKRRLLFLLGALIVYRIGAHVPVPGIDPARLAELFKSQSGGLLDMINMFSGGAVSRFSIFALGIMPYISASIIMQLLTVVSPTLEALKKEGESGRRKITQYTRYGTLGLATFQALGIAVGLESQLALDPCLMFRFNTVGTVRTGAFSIPLVLLLFLGAVLVTGLVVFVESGQRRIPVHYAKRQVGRKVYGGQSSFLPLKLNMSGVIPPIFASSLILFPATMAGWFGGAGEGGVLRNFLRDMAAVLSLGQPIYVILYASAIIFFCYFYTALVFNPKETAENLRKSGAFVPGIRPGEQTARYVERIILRLTLIGAIYVTLVCLLPEFLIVKWNVPFYFGGTSLLIIVVVTMDFMQQVQAYMMSHQYESLLKKANFKGGMFPTR